MEALTDLDIFKVLKIVAETGNFICDDIPT